MADLMKWTPFRFTRGRARNADVAVRPTTVMPMTLASMRDDMDRMFERFWTDPFAALDVGERWFGSFSAPEFQPRLDVTDDKNNLRVALEVPGMDIKDLTIEVHDGVLTVSGEKKQETTSEDEGCYHTERSYGAFRRAIPLPAEVDSTKAEAKFDKGVLTIRLPKTERAKQQTVKVAIKG